MTGDRDPFFIVGTGRSGTTMFRKLVAKHRDVYVPRETHFIPLLHERFGTERADPAAMMNVVERTFMARGETALIRILRYERLDPDAFRDELMQSLNRDPRCTVREFCDTFYTLLAQKKGCTIRGDKTPDYGLCMPMLRTIWPEAKFIHICRDGRDVALSMSKVPSFRILAAANATEWWPLALDRSYETHLAASQGDLPIDRFYELWRRRYTGILDGSNSLPGDAYLAVRYEEILANPEAVLERVREFLDLPHRPRWIPRASAMIERDRINRNVEKPEYRRLTERYADDLHDLGFNP